MSSKIITYTITYMFQRVYSPKFAFIYPRGDKIPSVSGMRLKKFPHIPADWRRMSYFGYISQETSSFTRALEKTVTVRVYRPGNFLIYPRNIEKTIKRVCDSQSSSPYPSHLKNHKCTEQLILI